MLTINPPNGRGCGTRNKEGCYLSVGIPSVGLPIEHFIIDPVRLWPGDFQRGFKVVPVKSGYNNVIIFIGEAFYTSPWDFVEEAKLFGISRKIPPTFPIEKLTPGQSKLYFCHPKAFISEELWDKFECDRKAPLNKYCEFYNLEDWDKTISGWHPKIEKYTACAFGLKDLSFWIHFPKNNWIVEPGKNQFEVQMPSLSYKSTIPIIGLKIYENPTLLSEYLFPGIFMWAPLSHIEFPFKANKKFEEKANKAGFETIITNF